MLSNSFCMTYSFHLQKINWILQISLNLCTKFLAIHRNVHKNKHIFEYISRNTKWFLMKIDTHTKQKCVFVLSNQNRSLCYISQVKTQVLQTLLSLVLFFAYFWMITINLPQNGAKMIFGWWIIVESSWGIEIYPNTSGARIWLKITSNVDSRLWN